MRGMTIQDILGQIEQRLDTLNMIDQKPPAVSLDPLSEVGLYITSDRLLADLYRQYLESQRHYIRSMQTHGKDAPMTEIASDMADSCFCAVETRLIELRQEKEMQAKVQRVQETQREKYIEEMEARQKSYATRGIKQPIKINKQPEQSSQRLAQSQNMNFWALFAMALMHQEAPQEYNQKLAVLHFAQAAA